LGPCTGSCACDREMFRARARNFRKGFMKSWHTPISASTYGASQSGTVTGKSFRNAERATMTDNRKGPTLSDVARMAGVSIATASKALNGREHVRESTRQRVFQVAE